MPTPNWPAIDSVLLDMDGTLLDLHFDNHFWLEHLPKRYAEHHGLTLAQAQAELVPLFKAHAGQLTWYCLDFWKAELGLDVVQLKREVAHLIALKPGVEAFLAALKKAGKRVALITNAHRDSLSLKMERVNLAPWFDRLSSSHDYGFPKEDQQFWQALRGDWAFDPARSLFIDDSLPILRSAQAFGVRELRAIGQPDSRQLGKDCGEFAFISDWDSFTATLAVSVVR